MGVSFFSVSSTLHYSFLRSLDETMTNIGETKVENKLDKFIRVLDVFVIVMTVLIMLMIVEHAY